MNAIQPKTYSPDWEIKDAQRKAHKLVCSESELNGEATTKLFYRYAPSLFAYLRQHTASREDAEDLLHEIFAAALAQPQFDLLSDEEQAQWLWRVARNKAVDTYRYRTRRPSLTLDYVADELFAGEEQSPEYELLRREEYACLLAALEQLPVIQQEALRLRFVNNLPCADVAKALGKHEGTVRSMLSRAIGRLRTIYTSKKEV